MTKISVVNLNLAQLPKAAWCVLVLARAYMRLCTSVLQLSVALCACTSLNPSPNYYKQFNGYTLGLLFAEVFIGSLWLLGRAVARLTLRHLPEREQRHRLLQFNSAVLSRLLLLLYVVYPGVSVAIFGSCA